ncbi:MAG: RNA methyltransferase [Betaproteobacteria bacterium]|nr:MAG: RNA methyltransferase [Betaproteobacteria bacterium]
MPRVSSPANPRFKETVRLIESSRERRKTGRCVLEGEHLVAVYCDRIGAPETLLVVEEALDDPRIATLIERVPDHDVLVVSQRMFANIASLPADIGVLAVVQTPAPTLPAPEGFCLLLENIQDPGNVGTMLRTAAAAGVAQVLLSKHCAFAWSPKVLRAGQGAHFLTTIVEDIDLCAWSAAFRAGGGHVVALIARDGRDLYDTEVDWPLALAVGNEGAGVSDALCAQADVQVTIPMPGGTESLNAAAAAAVALFECVRRKRASGSQ